jgi:hypothetical protein
MRSQKFLPDVKRNRCFTNWVRARERHFSLREGFQVRMRKFTRPAIISVTWLAVFGGSALGLGGHLFEPPVQTPKATEPTSGTPVAPKTCDVEGSISAKGVEMASRAASPLVAGFEFIASHSLGGVLIADYRCEASKESAVFRVRWELANTRWQVKKISRPPERQSGDL